MEIDSIELRKINLPYKNPFKTSGWTQSANTSVLIKIVSGKYTGWGEAPVSTVPWYLKETTFSVWNIITQSLAPLLFNNKIHNPSAIHNIIKLKGNETAIAGLEFALWDLFGKINNKSAAWLIGGTQKRIPVGVSIGIADNVNNLLKVIDSAVKDGYKRVKLKIKPGYDIELVKAVREFFPELFLQVDANCAYTKNDISLLKELDNFNLLMIEQPFAENDLPAHAALQEIIKTPVCLDESITSTKQLETAINLGALRILTIKAARAGGLTPAIDLYNIALKNNIPLWCGGLLETGIGRAMNVAFASLPGFTLPGDISTNKRYFERDIVTNPFELNSDGTLTVPDVPGIGINLDEDYLNFVTLEHSILFKE